MGVSKLRLQNIQLPGEVCDTKVLTGFLTCLSLLYLQEGFGLCFFWKFRSKKDADYESLKQRTEARKSASQVPESFDGLSIKARLKIKYEDADGEVTDREIHAFRYDSYAGHIHAFCQTRKANRTFRIDRVIETTDLDTGEVVKNIRSFLRTKRVKTN